MSTINVKNMSELNSEELMKYDGGNPFALPALIVAGAALYVTTRNYIETRAREDARRDSCVNEGYCK
ncbi:bacteriocin class II family protein [Paenibacillus planticolens]|nr:bacteriocin class II family protein [Paenibacillus planticolens]